MHNVIPQYQMADIATLRHAQRYDFRHFTTVRTRPGENVCGFSEFLGWNSFKVPFIVAAFAQSKCRV